MTLGAGISAGSVNLTPVDRKFIPMGTGPTAGVWTELKSPAGGSQIWVYFGDMSGAALELGRTYVDPVNGPGQPFISFVRDGTEYTRGEFTVFQFAQGPDGTLTHLYAEFKVGTALAQWGGAVAYHYTGSVLANDTEASGLPLTASLEAPPSHGTVSLNPDGTFLYTPQNGYVGDDSFTYIASSSAGSSGPTDVTIRVLPVNQAPRFSKGAGVVTDEDTAITIPGWATAISPGAASEVWQELTFDVSSDNPALLDSISLDPETGDLTVVPAENAHGVARVTVTLRDDGGTEHDGRDTSDPATFDVTVRPVIDAPVARGNYYDLETGHVFVPDPSRPVYYLYLEGDPDDPVTNGRTYFLDMNGLAGPTSAGVVRFITNLNPPDLASQILLHFAAMPGNGGGPGAGLAAGAYLGAASGVNADDDGVALPGHPYLYVTGMGPTVTSSTGWFEILDIAFDDSPWHKVTRFAADFVQYANGSTTAAARGWIRYGARHGTLLGDDFIDDQRLAAGKTLSAELVVGPAHGVLALSADGSFSYTPAAGYVGIDTFTYRVSDGVAFSEPATVTLHVTPATQPRPYEGIVQNVYPGPDGNPVSTRLGSRLVFDDVNSNGRPDPGEASAITGPDGRYRLTLAQGMHTIRLAHRDGWIVPPGFADSYTFDASLLTHGLEIPPLSAAFADPVVIDVLAVHPEGDPADWSNLIAAYVREANRVFANSETFVRLNLVHRLPVAYSQHFDLGTDLARLANAGDGHMDSVQTVRDQFGADLVVLVLPRTTGQVAGIAYRFDPADPDPRHGFLAVARTGNLTFDGQTLAHEVGHTLGADHDPEDSPTSPVPYARGIQFVYNGQTYGDIMVDVNDVDFVLPYFSNPDILFNDQPVGGTTADNARVVRENARIVASYRIGPRAPSPQPGPDPGPDPGPVPEPDPGPRPAPPSFPLRATFVATPKLPVKVGTTLSLSATIRNTGKTRFSGKLRVAFYLSKDRTLDSADLLLKRQTLFPKNLRPSLTVRATATPTAPKRWARGTYYVLAVATPTGTSADERSAGGASALVKLAKPFKPVPGPKAASPASGKTLKVVLSGKKAAKESLLFGALFQGVNAIRAEGFVG